MTHNNRRKKPESCVLSPPQLLKNPAKSLEFTAESRLSSLKQTLHAVYTKILEDPMTKVLSNDHTSCEFVTARVNEIFNESIDNEREHYYSSLFEKYLQENLELRDQLLEVVAKSEQKTKEFEEKLEKTESLLQFERLQGEKLSRDYSELLKKFAKNSQDFDELLSQKHEEKHSEILQIELENHDLKAKLLDFEEICERMDGEIAEKLEEIKKIKAFSEKNAQLTQEKTHEIQRKDQEILRKDQELSDLREKLAEILAKTQENTEEVARNSKEMAQEIEFLKEKLRKDAEKEVSQRNSEFQERISQNFAEETRKFKEKFKKKLEKCRENCEFLEESLKIAKNQEKSASFLAQSQIQEKDAELQDLREILQKSQEKVHELQENIEKLKKEHLLEKDKNQAFWEDRLKKTLDLFESKHKIQENVEKNADFPRIPAEPAKILRSEELFSVKKHESLKKSVKTEFFSTDFCNNSSYHSIFQDQVKSLAEIAQSLRAELEDSQRNLQKSKESLNSLLKSHESLELSQFLQARRFEELKTRNSQQIELLQKNLENARCEISAISLRNEQLSRENEQFSAEKDDFQEKLLRKSQDFAIQAELLQKLRQDHAALSLRNSEICSEISQKTRKIAEFEETLRLKTAEIQGLEQENLEMKRFIQEKTEESVRVSLQKDRILAENERNLGVYRSELEEKLAKTLNLEKNLEITRVSCEQLVRERDVFKEKAAKIATVSRALEKEAKKLAKALQNLRVFAEKLKETAKKLVDSRFAEVSAGMLQFRDKFVEIFARNARILQENARKSLESSENARKLQESEFLQRERALTAEIEGFSRFSQEKDAKIQELEARLAEICESSRSQALENRELLENLRRKHEEFAVLQENLRVSLEKEQNFRREVEFLRESLKNLEKKHVEMFEATAKNIENLQENNSAEIREISQNYEEVVEVLQKKLENCENEAFSQKKSFENQCEGLRNELLAKELEFEEFTIKINGLERSLQRITQEKLEIVSKSQEIDAENRQNAKKLASFSKEIEEKEQYIRELQKFIENLRENREKSEKLAVSEKTPEEFLRKPDNFSRKARVSPKKRPESLEKCQDLRETLKELRKLGEKFEDFGSFEGKTRRFANKKR